MATKKSENVLTEQYLASLYNLAIQNNEIAAAVTQHMKDEFLPDSCYQQLNQALKSHYEIYNAAPGYSVLTQQLSSSRAVSELLEEIRDTHDSTDTNAVRDSLETYLKQIQFKRILKEVNKKYEDGMRIEAMDHFVHESSELQKFTLKRDPLVDVAQTYESRLRQNKLDIENSTERPVNSWFIPQLDAMNQGRNLRTQLSCLLAEAGVGKSTCLRYWGYMNAFVAGHDVLHFQLEGSENEVLDAYSGMLGGTSAWEFERGKVNPHTLEMLKEKMQTFSGTLKVRAYTKFAKEATTRDIMMELEEYKKKYGRFPSVILIDSGDLLGESSGKSYDPKNLRHKRLKVFQELKDICGLTRAHGIVSYQAVILNSDFRNDERKVLTSNEISESKGIVRPLSHLLSVNQSVNEYKQEICRIHVEKYRFAAKCADFRIACDYSHGWFYSAERSLNLPNEEG